jgi:hypothetical protein
VRTSVEPQRQPHCGWQARSGLGCLSVERSPKRPRRARYPPGARRQTRLTPASACVSALEPTYPARPGLKPSPPLAADVVSDPPPARGVRCRPENSVSPGGCPRDQYTTVQASRETAYQAYRWVDLDGGRGIIAQLAGKRSGRPSGWSRAVRLSAVAAGAEFAVGRVEGLIAHRRSSSGYCLSAVKCPALPARVKVPSILVLASSTVPV